MDLEEEEKKTGRLRAENQKLREGHKWMEAQKDKAERVAMAMDEQEREITRLAHAEEVLKKELAILKHNTQVGLSHMLSVVLVLLETYLPLIFLAY